MKVLFLLKQNSSYGYYAKIMSGLYNSAKFLTEALETRILGTECKMAVCVDGNSIDKEVYDYQPKIAVIEALWVTPVKLREVAKLHPRVTFVVRIHSNLPFLSNEGIAIEWIKEYHKIPKVKVSFNNQETSHDFNSIDIDNVYLPNIYATVSFGHQIITDDTIGLVSAKSPKHRKRVLDIGCFGAIRPLKNQLTQAIAAISYADATDSIIHFHVNGTRVEMSGDSALKNIRALFHNSKHKLIEHGWLHHDDFIELIKTMDLGLQISLTESFNIVTADFAACGIPIIVSPEIEWMPDICKVSPYSVEGIVNKIDQAMKYRHLFTVKAIMKLYAYNGRAVSHWSQFFKSVKRS